MFGALSDMQLPLGIFLFAGAIQASGPFSHDKAAALSADMYPALHVIAIFSLEVLSSLPCARRPVAFAQGL